MANEAVANACNLEATGSSCDGGSDGVMQGKRGAGKLEADQCTRCSLDDVDEDAHTDEHALRIGEFLFCFGWVYSAEPQTSLASIEGSMVSLGGAHMRNGLCHALASVVKIETLCGLARHLQRS